jgi:hypothetical protein
MEVVGIFNGHLIYFTVIWYILWLFSIIFHVLVFCPTKNLANLKRVSEKRSLIHAACLTTASSIGTVKAIVQELPIDRFVRKFHALFDSRHSENIFVSLKLIIKVLSIDQFHLLNFVSFSVILTQNRNILGIT